MANLTSLMAETVVFLFDEGGHIPLGTAFVVGYPIDEATQTVVPLLVTAKHVIGDRNTVVARFSPRSDTRPVSVSYDLAKLRAEGDMWEHVDDGVDIVVFRTLHYRATSYNPFPLRLIASKQDCAEHEVVAADRVVFPCLLTHFMGTARNYPVVRSGTIALVPEEPVPLKYRVGSRQITTQQELVFIDATSVPGASGAPVFLAPGPRLKGNTYTLGGTPALLLGVMHGFYVAARELVNIQSQAMQAFAENTGIAIVFPSWRLLEILQQSELKKRVEELVGSENIHDEREPDMRPEGSTKGADKGGG
jgi:hypothetical protein